MPGNLEGVLTIALLCEFHQEGGRFAVESSYPLISGIRCIQDRRAVTSLVFSAAATWAGIVSAYDVHGLSIGGQSRKHKNRLLGRFGKEGNSEGEEAQE